MHGLKQLKNSPRLLWKLPHQHQPKSIGVFVDADFAARVLREIANRVWIQHAQRGGTVHVSTCESEYYAIYEVLSAQLEKSSHPERLLGDGLGSCLVGRECWHWDRIETS